MTNVEKSLHDARVQVAKATVYENKAVGSMLAMNLRVVEGLTKGKLYTEELIDKLKGCKFTNEEIVSVLKALSSSVEAIPKDIPEYVKTYYVAMMMSTVIWVLERILSKQDSTAEWSNA